MDEKLVLSMLLKKEAEVQKVEAEMLEKDVAIQKLTKVMEELTRRVTDVEAKMEEKPGVANRADNATAPVISVVLKAEEVQSQSSLVPFVVDPPVVNLETTETVTIQSTSHIQCEGPVNLAELKEELVLLQPQEKLQLAFLLPCLTPTVADDLVDKPAPGVPHFRTMGELYQAVKNFREERSTTAQTSPFSAIPTVRVEKKDDEAEATIKPAQQLSLPVGKRQVEVEDKECFNCGVTRTPIWRRDTVGHDLCNPCGLYSELCGMNRPLIRLKKPNGTIEEECLRCDSLSTGAWKWEGIRQDLCNACGIYLMVEEQRKQGTLVQSKKPAGERECFNCGCMSSPVWRRDAAGHLLCNACGLYLNMNGKHRLLVKPKAQIATKEKNCFNSGTGEETSPKITVEEKEDQEKNSQRAQIIAAVENAASGQTPSPRPILRSESPATLERSRIQKNVSFSNEIVSTGQKQQVAMNEARPKEQPGRPLTVLNTTAPNLKSKDEKEGENTPRYCDAPSTQLIPDALRFSEEQEEFIRREARIRQTWRKQRLAEMSREQEEAKQSLAAAARVNSDKKEVPKTGIYPTLPALDKKEYTILTMKRSFRSKQSAMLVMSEDRSKWISLFLPQMHRYALAAVVLDGVIYLLDLVRNKNILLKLDNETLVWLQQAEMKQGRACVENAVVPCKGSLFVFGGHSNGQSLKSVERYYPKTNTWLAIPEMKYARSGAAAAVWNGKIIVCGGLNNNEAVRSVECLDPDSYVWTEFKDMPLALWKPLLLPCGRDFIVLGVDKDMKENVVMKLTGLENKGTWKQLPSMKEGSIELAASVLDGNVYVMGGWTAYGFDVKKLSRVEIFDGNNWRNGPEFPTGCPDIISVVIPQILADTLCNGKQ